MHTIVSRNVLSLHCCNEENDWVHSLPHPSSQRDEVKTRMSMKPLLDLVLIRPDAISQSKV